MATAAQVEANRQNALLSTGPSSPTGKVASSGNSRTHGLSAESILGESTDPRFASRLREWARSYPVETPDDRLALETAVAMTFRLEACGIAHRAAVEEQSERARHAWQADRLADAAALFGQIGRRPEVIAPKLATTRQGVELLLLGWGRLAEALDAKDGAWSEADVDMACHLLGLPLDLRDGRLPFDPTDPAADPRDVRRQFVRRELDRFKVRAAALEPLDKADRERAERGTLALLSRPVKLALRYEREAQRRYDAALRTIKASRDTATEPLRPAPRAKHVAPRPASSEAAMEAMVYGDSQAMMKRLQRDLAALDGLRPTASATPAIPSPSSKVERPAARPNRRARRAAAAMARAGH